MPDIFASLWMMGVPNSDMTDQVSRVEPFRVSTVGERLMIRAAVESMFGLDVSGFAESPWGFPPIPVPVNREHTGSGLMIAPAHITFEGLGHPIFWTDPQLTRRTPLERERPELWGIRMFYLLMALGAYDPDTLQWRNIPRLQGIQYDQQDWMAYRAGVSSALDFVKPLSQDDLLEPLSAVTRQAELAIAKCEQVQAELWTTYRQELRNAYDTAIVSTQGRSEWDSLDIEMRETIKEITEALERNTVPSSLVPNVYSQIEKLSRIVAHNERCAQVLAVPVLRSEKVGDRASAAATAIAAARSEVNVSVDDLRALAHSLFGLHANSSASDFTRLHQESTAVYMRSWRTLMVSARNLIAAAQNKPIYGSWETFELAESADAMEWPPLEHLVPELEGQGS